MQNKISEIDALVQKAETQLQTIREKYTKSLIEKEVAEELKVDIKNFFENLRSALDFSTHAIHDKFMSCGKYHNIYFPVRKNVSEFKKAVRQSMHDLDVKQPNIYKIVETIQPYYGNENAWISKFFNLCNLKKHVTLTEQTRIERHEVTISAKGSIVGWNPDAITFGSGVSILGSPVNPKTQMPEPYPDHEVNKIIWVGFVFNEINEDALPFMERALNKVKAITNDIKKEVA